MALTLEIRDQNGGLVHAETPDQVREVQYLHGWVLTHLMAARDVEPGGLGLRGRQRWSACAEALGDA